jgi:hypothetical protein
MLKGFRAWRAARKQRKLDRYSDELGHMDARKLQQLRDQQSPLRSRRSIR